MRKESEKERRTERREKGREKKKKAEEKAHGIFLSSSPQHTCRRTRRQKEKKIK